MEEEGNHYESRMFKPAGVPSHSSSLRKGNGPWRSHLWLLVVAFWADRVNWFVLHRILISRFKTGEVKQAEVSPRGTPIGRPLQLFKCWILWGCNLLKKKDKLFYFFHESYLTYMMLKELSLPHSLGPILWAWSQAWEFICLLRVVCSAPLT